MKYPPGTHVILTHVAPKPEIPIVGVVEGNYESAEPSTLWVRCLTGSRAGGRWPHLNPHVNHLKLAEWCETGEHWGPGRAKDDYMCLACREALS